MQKKVGKPMKISASLPRNLLWIIKNQQLRLPVNGIPTFRFTVRKKNGGNISMRLKRESLHLGMKLKKNLHNGRRITSQTG